MYQVMYCWAVIGHLLSSTISFYPYHHGRLQYNFWWWQGLANPSATPSATSSPTTLPYHLLHYILLPLHTRVEFIAGQIGYHNAWPIILPDMAVLIVYMEYTWLETSSTSTDGTSGMQQSVEMIDPLIGGYLIYSLLWVNFGLNSGT